jgi:hypothetical protein
METIFIIWKFLKNYWWAGLILLVLVFFGFTKYWKNQAEQNDARANRWKSNYDNMVTDYRQTKDKLGRTETTVKKLRISKKELQSDLYKKNKVLADLKKELEYSNVKIKDLENTIIAELSSSNQGTTVIIDTLFKEKPKERYDYMHVTDNFLSFKAWWLEVDSVQWLYEYNETIYYWTELRTRMYNDEGNKRFFLWRWIWPDKRPVTKVKSINSNSEIKAKEYEFE